VDFPDDKPPGWTGRRDPPDGNVTLARRQM
jgi:hypothetical protein